LDKKGEELNLDRHRQSRIDNGRAQRPSRSGGIGQGFAERNVADEGKVELQPIF
jgi:hypothetical protein